MAPFRKPSDEDWAQQEYWKSVSPILVLIDCCFERILEDMVSPLDQTIRLRVVGSRGAVVVELGLLSLVAAGELGASVSNQVNWHTN